MTPAEFFTALFADADKGFINIWTLPDKKSAYFSVTEAAQAASYAEGLFDTHDVYFGIGLREKPIKDEQTGYLLRGGNKDVTTIPAFWADIDVFGPAHAETELPKTDTEAMEFLESLPFAPTMVVSSGNGLHVYWQFAEPVVFATDAHRDNIAEASAAWQRFVNAKARERGWKLDNVSDLARALRVPGGINHKANGSHERAQVIAINERRYSLADFKPIVQPYMPQRQAHGGAGQNSRNNGGGNVNEPTTQFNLPVGKAERIIGKCAFIDYCRDNAATLPEPYWYAMTSNLALCADGVKICHEFSKPYHDYKERETDRKIAHAREESKPHTCAYIRDSLGFDCGGCAAKCKAPVGLAVIGKAEETANLLSAEITDYDLVFADTFIEALSYAKSKLPAEYAKFKLKHKSKLPMRELEKCIKDYDARRRQHESKARNGENGELLNLDGIDLNGAVVPHKWQVTLDGGVRRFVESKNGVEEVVVCPVPVVIKRRLVNIDDDTEQLELCFYKDFHWKSVIGRRTQLNNKNSVLSFGDAGLQVTSNTASEFVSYLTDYETANKDVIERVHSTARLGWIGDAYRSSQFFPYATNEPVVFEEDKGTHTLYKNLTECGSYDEWLDMMRELRKNPIARFISSASFASPLLCKIGVRTFVIHLWHMSASGKSAALKAAISVWGNPLRIMGGGFATIVGLEQLAGTLRYLPFGIDEKQAADERRLPMDNMLYILGQGFGKTRGAKGGGNAEATDWHNIIILTGEEPVTKNAGLDGVQTRTFELYGKPVDDADFAKDVHVISENNYGFAGPRFISEVCRIAADSPDYLRKEYKNITAKLKERGYKNVHADYVAAVALGDYLAERIVFGANAEDAMTAALDCAEVIYKLNESEMSADSIERGWEFVTGWIVSNAQKFSADSQIRYGSCTHNAVEGVDEYFVIPQYLDAALTDSTFNAKKVISGLRERNLIVVTKGADGKFRTKCRRRVDGKLIAGYLFKLGNDKTAAPLTEDV